MNPFAEKYKTLSNAQLLEIIDTADNYQPVAVTAAEDELLVRNLSIADMAAARAENEIAANDKAAKMERKKALEDKLINAAGVVMDTISPVQKTPASASKVILLISLVCTLLGLVRFYSIYGIMRYAFSDDYHKIWTAALPGLFEGVFLCGTAYMFWKRMKWGWIFLAVYLFFAPVGALIVLIAMFLRDIMRLSDDLHLWREYARSTIFEMLFYGTCIWFLYRSSIRALYRVDKTFGIITAAAGVFLALLVFALIAARAY